MGDLNQQELSQQELQTIGRFSIRRKLGAGSFGVVYEAYDREHNSIVALKLLKLLNADALYQFKQEFRALADITHPNLVTLYELISDGEQWFLTMELVRGINLLEYLRGDQANIARHAASLADSPTLQMSTPVETSVAFAQSNPTANPTADPMAETQSASLSEITIDDKIFIAPSLPPDTIYRLNTENLRATLTQLAEGVAALHKAGKLHRDIKPSNVLVTAAGRVVILDFGLVTELNASGLNESGDFVGTPNYMSPEQGAGFPVSEASDWYSVGVILYEILTGRLPFIGHLEEIIVNKQRSCPLAPWQLIEGVPIDLSKLCLDLLNQLPEDRPAGKEILRRINSSSDVDIDEWQHTKRESAEAAAVAVDDELNNGRARAASTPQLTRSMPFVGRESHLGYLMGSYLLTKQQRAVIVYVHGRSGMGKSSLIRRFLAELPVRESVVILTGRCYEKESVPYKAFDSLIDALTQYLKSLPNVEIELLLPRDVPALARLFPVLRQLEAVVIRQQKNIEIPDPQELRRRAFTALRELLSALSARQSLVLFIDDLHWGDIDSVALLGELLRPPQTPPMLLIASYRSEEADTSPFLKALAPLRVETDDYEVRELSVGELDTTESRALANALLGGQAKHLESIIQEAGGSPYFIDELVRYSQSDGFVTTRRLDDENITGEESVERARLDQLIHTRVRQLPERARQLLEVVAIAGKPLDIAIARKIVELDIEEQAILSMLRAGRWIRMRHLPARNQIESYDEIESYHDRIRETIVARLPAERLKGYHLQLALALEAGEHADPEELVVHFQAAGDREKTAKYAVLAAEQVSNALAFDRAARLYRLALELHTEQQQAQSSEKFTRQSFAGSADFAMKKFNDLVTEQSLRIKLGEALTKAGRGAEAAAVYLDAARGARETLAIELQRRAAEQFLFSGHIDSGLTALRVVLRMLGMRLPATPWGAVCSLLFWRMLVLVRGVRFHERDAAEIAKADLIRIDTYNAVALGLGQVDPVRGANFQTRNLLLALEAGEPNRICRALAAEICYYAAAGGRSQRRAEQLSQLATALSERIQSAPARGFTTQARGFAAFARGDWQQGYELNERAETILREKCAGVTLELDTAQYYTLCSLQHMGRLKAVFERLPVLLKEARERGDLYAETLLSARYSYAGLLCNDDVNGAQTDLHQSMSRWSREGFHHQHYLEMSSQTQIYLYADEGVGERAWQYITSRWPALKRSLFILVQVVRIEALHTRGRTALAAAAASRDGAKYLRAAEQDANRIAREQSRWGRPFVDLIRAGINAHHGQYQTAIKLLEVAEDKLREVDMRLYSSAVCYRRGQLIGGDAGAALIERASQAMRDELIKNPARMTEMLVPGRWRR